MTTLFIFFLLFLSLLLGLFNYRKLCLFTGFVTFFSFIVIGNGFFPSILLPYLQKYRDPQIEWKKSNTILIFGTGTSKTLEDFIKPSLMAFSRIAIAAKLYRECKNHSLSCNVVISGGDTLNHGKTEAATYKDMLLALGITQTDIQLEQNSKNTFQNAKFTTAILKEQPSEQLLIVSSSLTLKRALLYFSYFNVFPIPVSSDFFDVHISKFPSSYNFTISDFAVHEVIGIARYHIYNFFGLNIKSQSVNI